MFDRPGLGPAESPSGQIGENIEHLVFGDESEICQQMAGCVRPGCLRIASGSEEDSPSAKKNRN